LRILQPHSSVEMRLDLSRLDLDGQAEMHFSFAIVACLIFEHSQQTERVEMSGRELEQLPANRLSLGNPPGILQRQGALVQLRQFRLLLLLAPGTVERALADVIAHGSSSRESRARIDDRRPEYEATWKRPA